MSLKKDLDQMRESSMLDLKRIESSYQNQLRQKAEEFKYRNLAVEDELKALKQTCIQLKEELSKAKSKSDNLSKNRASNMVTRIMF